MIGNVSSSDTIWRLAPYPWAKAETLARELGVPFVVAGVLASRGLTEPSQAEAFLTSPNLVPDPFLFRDMEGVVRVLAEAIESGRRVVVHGDYDADGITATALLVLGLRSFGLQPEWYLPNRFSEGYGLSKHAVETIAGKGPGLLVTVDCGVNYPAEVALARQMGLDVVVIDHHEPGPVLPDCHLIHTAAGDYPSRHLCGVGLAFKVLHGLHVGLRGAERIAVPAALHEYLDLVAVGSVADLVPLLGENRYYVKEGLKLLSIGTRPGFRALTRVGGCAGEVDSGAVAFRIAPRLNAAGRLLDASLPLELLLTQDERRAKDIAEELHELNGERQQVERRIFEEAMAQAEALPDLPPVLVLSGAGWHEGVVGIVASRMVERYHRPAILLSVRDGVAKGSGRSIAAYDLVSGLSACGEWLTVYGGHTMAAGLALPEENIERFAAAIQTHARGVLVENDFIPVYRADGVLRGADINSDTATALASLGPFGSGNPRPRLLVLDAQVVQPEVTRSGEHLRCLIEVEGARVRAIGFGMGALSTELLEQSRRKVVGVELRNSEWQGTLRPEFVLQRIGGPMGDSRVSRFCNWSCPYHEMSEASVEWAQATKKAAWPARGQTAQTTIASEHKSAVADARCDGGSLAAIGRVLATGEPCLLLVCSLVHSLPELEVAISLTGIAADELGCASRCCSGGAYERLLAAQVVVGEWDAVMKDPRVAEARTHVVVVDPPYRGEHRALLKHLAARGVKVHALYGERERRRTARLLKYLVHPRFAMVCVYRALLGGAQGRDVPRAAAEVAWGEGGVALCAEDFERAWRVLAELGLDRPSKGTGRIEASSVPLYADAEAEYEECFRQCRTP